MDLIDSVRRGEPCPSQMDHSHFLALSILPPKQVSLMFPVNLIRHKDPELFFAIVAPVGANIEAVCDGLSEELKAFKYKVHQIRVIERLKQFEKFLKNEPTDEYKKLKNRMDEGDRFREEMERDDALALLSLSDVIKFRAKNTSAETVSRQAYVFRSLKRPEEVTALRRIYGSNLIVVGVHSAREQRVDNLAERFAKSRFSAQHDQFRDKAEELVLRDESDERRSHGQRLRFKNRCRSRLIERGSDESRKKSASANADLSKPRLQSLPSCRSPSQ